MSQAEGGRATRRQLLVWAGLFVALVVLGLQLARLTGGPSPLFSADFGMFLATARLNLRGDNPYDPDSLLPLERIINPSQSGPIIMYSPPWTLTLLEPFGLFDPGVGRALWLLFHFLVILLCADWTWRLYGGSARFRWVAWVLSLTFLPTLHLLRTGQTGSLVLLGVVGFLRFERRRRDGWAGALLALSALKPHLVYLLWLAVLAWVVYRHRWRVLLGAGLALLVATAVPLATNPLAVQQYRQAVAHHPPLEWATPTLGVALRLVLGPDQAWLQVAPLAVGVLTLVPYWVRNRGHWVWARQAPLLVLVSFLTTCYGAWSHDYVVCLLPILQAAVWAFRTRRAATAALAAAVYVAVNALIVLLDVAGLHNELWLLWMSPALVTAYLLLRGMARPRVGRARETCA
jgi:hypothetical protein